MLINGMKNKSRMLDEYTSAGLFLNIVISNILAQLILQTLFGSFGYSLLGDMPMVNLLCTLGLQIIFLGVYYKKVNLSYYEPCYKFRKSTSVVSYLLVVIMAIAMFIGFYLPTLWFYELISLTGYVGVGLELTSNLEIIFGIVIIVVVAPIVEELVFRGGILSGLKNYGIIKGVILTSAMFMIFHMSPTQTFYQFVVGVVAGFLAVYSGNVILPIILHAISNALAIVVSIGPITVVLSNFYTYLKANVLMAIIVTVVLLAICTGVILLAMYFIKRKEKFTAPQKEDIKVYKINPQELFDAIISSAKSAEARANIDPFSDEPIDNETIEPKAPPTVTQEVDEVATKHLKESRIRGAKTFNIIGFTICVLMWVMTFMSGFGV